MFQAFRNELFRENILAGGYCCRAWRLLPRAVCLCRANDAAPGPAVLVAAGDCRCALSGKRSGAGDSHVRATAAREFCAIYVSPAYIAVERRRRKGHRGLHRSPALRGCGLQAGAEQAPGASATTVTGLNNGGTVVCFYTSRRGNVTAFSERNGSWTHYAKGSDDTQHPGVNDGGIAVGFYTDRSGVNHGFTRNLKTGRITIIHRVAASLTAMVIELQSTRGRRLNRWIRRTQA